VDPSGLSTVKQCDVTEAQRQLMPSAQNIRNGGLDAVSISFMNLMSKDSMAGHVTEPHNYRRPATAKL
jgi:hypothetical protein